MPGIAGIIGTACSVENRGKLDAMVQCMLHEKFYLSGTFINEPLSLSVGWVSHTDSFLECMPIWNEDKNICLIFSGEDYQDRLEIDQLRAKGHRFNSKYESYLVHLYEELGLKFLERINGWFSGVLVDLKEATIHIFNDRYGLNRVYYHENEEGLYFSSEAKSLLRVLPQVRRF